MEYDILSFRLQSHNDSVIATLLVNNIPLYDNIICKHAELSFEHPEDRHAFIFESYDFTVYPMDPPSEETLFYYNFPENLMPLDSKHNMMGFTPSETFQILYHPFWGSNELELDKNVVKEMKENREFQGDDRAILCLVHVCGSTGCSSVQMNLEKHPSENTVIMGDFKDSFGTVFHPEIRFVFEEEPYLETLKALYKISKEEKEYADYQKFQTKRFHREHPNLFK